MKTLYFLVITFLVASCGHSPETLRPEKKPLVIAVYASGELEPDGLYRSYAGTTGTIEKIYVTEGDTVGAGVPLFTMRKAEDGLNLGKFMPGGDNTPKTSTVQSALPGMVYALLKKPGEPALAQEPIAIIGSADKYNARLTIDEMDISRIKTGQKVYISIDTYGDSLFEGEITRIYPQPDMRTRSFRADARFTSKMPKLYPGLTLEANIIIETKQDVLTVPAEYIKDGKFIMLPDGTLKEVVTGETDNRLIEIISGIDENTDIILPITEL
jgi:multidrug efflux pump subunit AcrA (membrane-fusion protein)